MKKTLSIFLALLMAFSVLCVCVPASFAASAHDVALTYHPTLGNPLKFQLPADSPFYIPEDDNGCDQCYWVLNGSGTSTTNSFAGFPAAGKYYIMELKLRCKDEYQSGFKGFSGKVTFNGIALEQVSGNRQIDNLSHNQFSIFDDGGVLILKVTFFYVSTDVLPPYKNGTDAFAVTSFDTPGAWYLTGETVTLYTRDETGCHNSGWMASPPQTFTKKSDGSYTFRMPFNNVECQAVMAENTVKATFAMPQEGDAVATPELSISGKAIIDPRRTDPQQWLDLTNGNRQKARGRFTAGHKYLASFCVYSKGGSGNVDKDTRFIINGKTYGLLSKTVDGTDYLFAEVPFNPTEHHYNNGVVTTAPTCVGQGEKTFTCPCGGTKTEPVPATGKHTYVIKDEEQDVWAATLDDDGYILYTCSVCGVTKKSVIPMVSGITVSKTVFTANGKVQKPAVTVKNRKGTALASGSYWVTYSNTSSKAAGKYKVTVSAGDWEDMRSGAKYYFTKTFTYTIKPAKTTGLKAVGFGTKTLKFSWTKVTGAKYYQVYLSTNGTSWKKAATVSTNAATIRNLQVGTKYQVKVRALDASKKVAGPFSVVLKTQTKTAAPVISKLTSPAAKTAKVTWGRVAGAGKYAVYKSADKKTWTKVGETTGLTLTLTKLTAGKRIYVKVLALNAYGRKSAFSAVKYVTVKK